MQRHQEKKRQMEQERLLERKRELDRKRAIEDQQLETLRMQKQRVELVGK